MRLPPARTDFLMQPYFPISPSSTLAIRPCNTPHQSGLLDWPGSFKVSALIMPLAALYSHLLVARPSLCALEALRGTSSGATMTTPVGRAHSGKHLCNFPRARRTGFSHTAGALTSRGSGPSLCPSQKGERQTYAPPSPLAVINAQTLREEVVHLE